MLSSIARIAVAGVPWLVIAALLYVALFVKPDPVGKTVIPSAIESRDRFYGVASPTEEILWLAGADGKIVRSDDAGESWSIQPAPTQVHYQDIASWSPEKAVVVGNEGTVLTTSDGGKTWIAADAPSNDIANKLIDVKAYEGGEAWAVGEFGTILKTEDFGNSWSRMRELEDMILNEIVRIDGKTLIVVGEFGSVLRTEDGGATWQSVSSPVENSLMAIDFRDSQHGLAGGLEGVLIFTADGGKSWSKIAEQLELPPARVSPGTARRDSWADLSTEHIFALRWLDGIGKWVATGDKGIWVTGSSDFSAWQSGRLAEREMAWHTAMVPFLDGIVFSGMNLGYWDASSWELLGHD